MTERQRRGQLLRAKSQLTSGETEPQSIMSSASLDLLFVVGALSADLIGWEQPHLLPMGMWNTVHRMSSRYTACVCACVFKCLCVRTRQKLLGRFEGTDTVWVIVIISILSSSPILKFHQKSNHMNCSENRVCVFIYTHTHCIYLSSTVCNMYCVYIHTYI